MLDLSSIDEKGEYEDSVNLTITDQIMALRWVHENIGAFGGDAENITVFGQSAGGGSVSTLCCIPEANKYFQKAIIQSAGISDRTIRYRNDAKKVGEIIIKKLNVKSMEEMLAVSPEKLTEVAARYFDEAGGNNTVPFDPTWGVGNMPEDPLENVRKGAAGHLTIMTGSTSGEYNSWVAGMTTEEIRDMAKEASAGRLTDDMIEAFMNNDESRSERDSMIELHMDLLLRGCQICTLEALIKGGSKAFNYYISCVPDGAKYKPQHCFEIPYIMGKPMNYIYLDINSSEPCQGKNPIMELVGKLQGCWANFARYGNPNGSHMNTEWEPYTLENHETLVIDRNTMLVNGVRDKDMDIVRCLHR